MVGGSVERLIRQMGLQGAVRGCQPKTTAADPDTESGRLRPA
ncbi:hypothetical protein SALB1_0893 [Salinisphaera sp. LB1]|nr:hypothetical protein SALB1_0893 [Salinisphaera sp. LB1]